MVFITEMKSVYCAVRNRVLNKAVCASSLKGLIFIVRFLNLCRFQGEKIKDIADKIFKQHKSGKLASYLIICT